MELPGNYFGKIDYNWYSRKWKEKVEECRGTGMSWPQVAAIMNREGFTTKTGNPVLASSLYSIMKVLGVDMITPKEHHKERVKAYVVEATARGESLAMMAKGMMSQGIRTPRGKSWTRTTLATYLARNDIRRSDLVEDVAVIKAKRPFDF